MVVMEKWMGSGTGMLSICPKEKAEIKDSRIK
jgi:hypothetical protein